MKEGTNVTLHQKFNNVGVTVFLLCIACGVAVAKLMNMPLAALAGAIVGLYLLFAIVVVDQWEKVAVLRFGRYRGLRGPGLFLIIPVVEHSAAMLTSACASRRSVRSRR
jgi:regulator of protease activity HflC (stomatin/prohibitin superfamily)